MSAGVAAVVLLSAALFLLRDAPAAGDALQEPINHLLRYVEQSDCTFIRNGKAYSPRKAAEHMRRKYDHFKNKIQTPEDFIELTATRSAVSGKPYSIRCPGRAEVPATEWLHAELARYRPSVDESALKAGPGPR